MNEIDKLLKKDGTVTTSITFDEDAIEWLREKFNIQTMADFQDAVVECVKTYLET